MINPKTIIMLAILLVALMFVIQSTAGGGLEIRGGAMAISRKSVTALMMAISAVVLFFMVKSLCLWIWVPRRRL
jgi:preprotein translocase subunit SecG